MRGRHENTYCISRHEIIICFRKDTMKYFLLLQQQALHISRLYFSYTCTQINKCIYIKVILTHLKRKWQINQVVTASTVFESMTNEYPDSKEFEFPQNTIVFTSHILLA